MLYAGGDYALILNIMLLVQVMAYVMSGTFATDIAGRWTCALESWPLIGSPAATILPAGGIFGSGWSVGLAGPSVNLERLKRADVFVNM